MPYAAISYHVKPGSADRIAEILATFERPDPTVRDDDGQPIGQLLGTAVFIEGELMVRVVHYTGCELSDVSRYMAKQKGVYDIMRQLEPHLSTPRQTSSETEFVSGFAQATMRCLAQTSVPEEQLGVS